MSRIVSLTALAALAIATAACGERPVDRALTGGAIGAGGGALAGAVLPGVSTGNGALIGAVGGAAYTALKKNHHYYRDSRGRKYYIDKHGYRHYK